MNALTPILGGFLLAFLSISNAWAWPASDNFGAICALVDSSCLSRDWLAQSMYLGSPRSGIIVLNILIMGAGASLLESQVLIQSAVAACFGYCVPFLFLRFSGRRGGMMHSVLRHLFAIAIPVIATSGLAAFFALGWRNAWGINSTAASASSSLVLLFSGSFTPNAGLATPPHFS